MMTATHLSNDCSLLSYQPLHWELELYISFHLRSIHQSRSGKLVLTSSPYGKVMSTLWRVIDVSRNANNSFLNQVYAWESDNYTEFSKMVQDKVVGTQLEAAHVYDLNTGRSC